jgi:uncharacterized protein DUF3883
MKFQDLIRQYKDLIRDGNKGERYKWECINHFQDNFDIDAVDFGPMLKKALKKKSNLTHYISSSFIIQAAEQFPDVTIQMLRNLYDDTTDLKKRMLAFQQCSDEILQKLKNIDDKSKHQQDERTIAFYLTLMYPEKYCFYMDKIYRFLLHHLPEEKKRKPGKKLLHFNELVEKHLHLIEQDQELLDLVNNSLDGSCFQGNQARIILQDVLWRNYQVAYGMKCARICWNTNGWKAPSGMEGKSHSLDSHEGKYGYGNEEWLFDFKKLIDGYHYGFLQPINRGIKKYASEVLDVQLFTIDGATKTRYFVGQIKNLQVLTSDEADKIYQIYKQKGWLDKMAGQIEQLYGSPKDIFDWHGTNVLNVKFRERDVTINKPYIELPADHPVCKRDRYQLYNASELIFPDQRMPLVKTPPPKGIKNLPDYDPSFKGRDTDFEKKQRDQTIIGNSGEQLVIDKEKENLRNLGRGDLAKKVEKRKDGEGFDVRSYDKDGNEVFIEIKTTTGGINTPFDISLNEVKRAIKDMGRYKIYRLYNYNKKNETAEYYEVERIDQLKLRAVNYKAYWKEQG